MYIKSGIPFSEIVAMDMEPYPVVAELLIRKAVTW